MTKFISKNNLIILTLLLFLIIAIKITHSDTGSSAFNIGITVIGFDSDGDGTPDDEDSDDDNDGINDTDDFLTGNLTSINSATLLTINITIDGDNNLSKEFSGKKFINITNGTSQIVEFNWTFSSTSKLNLANITIEKIRIHSSIGKNNKIFQYKITLKPIVQ